MDVKIPLFALLLAASCTVPIKNEKEHLTALDIKSKNIEKIISCSYRLLGNDSSGLAAKEYIDATQASISRIQSDNQILDNNQPIGIIQTNKLLQYDISTPEEYRKRNINSLDSAPLKGARNYLMAEGARASARLNTYFLEYTKVNNLSDAKTALGYAVIALQLNPQPTIFESIADKMKVLCDSLEMHVK